MAEVLAWFCVGMVPGTQARRQRDKDADAIDARWAPEVGRAKREARPLADELTPERVRVRIARERDAAFEAARYRAGQLLQRALEGGNGQVRDP
jgi:hypothetical protein